MDQFEVYGPKGTGFTGCGKTRPGGMPGIYSRHKANQINVGFSH
jgi:hypothetical protein